MEKTLMQEKLRAEEQELEEDIDLLLDSISNLEETKPNGWEDAIRKARETKEQLEKCLDTIRSKLDPTMQDSDHDSFMLLTDKLINDTIGEYFRYHIWTHPDMTAALDDFASNGPECLPKYSDQMRKWMVIFNASKYREDSRNIEKEWMVHKIWVCLDDPGNPFSFKNTVEYRGVIEPKKLRRYLDDMAEWSLDDLMNRYEVFHAATQRQEKENIMAKRPE